MAEFKTYTRQEIADFTGRPVASFPQNFIDRSAVPQALLLFKMATCRSNTDDMTPDQLQLVDFAMLSLADAIHLTAPYQTVKYSPFNSESIGSYSYSRAASAIAMGQSTGVDWFDTAVLQLGVCDLVDQIPMSTGIDVFGAGYGMPQTGPGMVRYFTEADLAQSRFFGYDPSPSPVYQQPSPVSRGDAPIVPNDWVESPPGSGAYVPPGG